MQIGETGIPAANARDDLDWSTFFDVVLIPNPKLSKAQQKTIEHDYGMKAGKCQMRVRRALLYYFNKRLRLDVAEEQDRPKETPIIVANKKEYDAALKAVVY